jgi:hypothetical protein
MSDTIPRPFLATAYLRPTYAAQTSQTLVYAPPLLRGLRRTIRSNVARLGSGGRTFCSVNQAGACPSFAPYKLLPFSGAFYETPGQLLRALTGGKRQSIATCCAGPSQAEKRSHTPGKHGPRLWVATGFSYAKLIYIYLNNTYGGSVTRVTQPRTLRNVAVNSAYNSTY